jgi:hypothetical protein
MESRLTLIQKLDERTADKHILGLYRCACGGTLKVAMSRVRNGYTKSCGCISREAEAQKKHGMRNSPEYSSWQAMKGRCLDTGHKDYPRWGGRGVTVCHEWIASFEAFFAHVGPRPSGTTLDRIDGTKNYEPGNVRWATPTDQARNRRGAFTWHVKGAEFPSHGEAAKHFGVSEHTIWRWVNGQIDKRRGRFTPPREDCHVVPRY